MQVEHASHAFYQQQSRILLIEDEAVFARAVVKRLQKAGYVCEHAETIADGMAITRQFEPELVLLDMRLPDGNGLDIVADLAQKGAAVIVMTAHGELSDAVTAMKSGASDYLKKPIDLDELLMVLDKVKQSSKLKHQQDYARQRNAHMLDGVEMLGESSAMQGIKSQIARIAQLVGMADVPPPTVLINGETGTGKDVAARMLHHLGAFAYRPFVHVDCASLPAELIESELFGHEKGAFTSAQASRAGLIEAAENGSLFLDEIGELSLPLQAKLLNVLERRMVRRVGSTKERPVEARFIAATNRDLHQMVAQGKFRSDLYYRLNVLTILMPPLRDRGQDIRLLAQYFAEQTERRYGLPTSRFSVDAEHMLMQYPWPGNVRELRHQISRAVLLSKNGLIQAQDLAFPLLNHQGHQTNAQSVSTEHFSSGNVYQGVERRAQPNRSMPVPAEGVTLESAEKQMIETALAQSGNNVSEAARRLGITRMAMRYRMEKHGIRV